MGISLDPIIHNFCYSEATLCCRSVNKLCIEIHTDSVVSASEALSICSQKGSRVISPSDVKSLYWLKQLCGEGDGCLLSKMIIRGNINVTALKYLGF